MKKTNIFILLLFLVVRLFSQALPVHEKKVYISPEGKIFINKSLPIYLRFATSPDENARTYLLRSEVTTKYSNPMYFDTEGYNTFRTPSCVDTVTKKAIVPQQDIIYEVYSDSRVPVTKVHYGAVKTITKNGKIYVNGRLEFTLTASDEMSGVESTYYSINGENFIRYAGQIKLEEEKEYTIKYYSVDNVGNAESLKTIVLVIDKSKPVTSYKVEGDFFENILSARSKIILSVEDGSGIGTQGVYYKLDEGIEKKYTVPVSGAYIEQGEHTLTFYAKDLVENIEDIKTFSFYVDKTPPVIVQEITGKSFFAGGKEYSSGRSQMKFTTFDNKAGVKEVFYSINNEEYKKYDKPFLLSNVSGNLSVMAYATDNVNNKTTSIESGDKISIPYVDLTGPAVKHGFSGPLFSYRDTAYISEKTKILLTATDSESGIAKIDYSVDDQTEQNYQGEFSISQQGVHKIKVTGYDQVENTNSSEFFVVVDNTGPEIFEKFSTSPINKSVIEGKSIDEYPKHVVLFLSCTDKVVGFDQLNYSINGTPEKKYLSFISNFVQKGAYSIKVKAKDKLGNETTEVIDFTIGD